MSETEPGTGRPSRRGWRALLARPGRAQVAIAALCGLLAFGLVTQVQATSDNGLSAARTDDLLGILSDLESRADRIRADIADLQVSERRLRSGSGQTAAALREARDRARTLGILVGTLPAAGPGVVLTVDDPQHRVRPEVLLDAVEELRDAGAEALQLSGVRVAADTAIVSSSTGIEVGGRPATAPYRLLAIGDRQTLAAALGITGGVL